MEQRRRRQVSKPSQLLITGKSPIALIFVISPFSSGQNFCRMACSRMEMEQAFFQKLDSAKGLLNLAYQHMINMYSISIQQQQCTFDFLQLVNMVKVSQGIIMKGGSATTSSDGNYGCAGILLWLNSQSTCSILCSGTSSSSSSSPYPPTTFFLDKTNLTSAITTQLFSCSCVILDFLQNP